MGLEEREALFSLEKSYFRAREKGSIYYLVILPYFLPLS